MALLWVLGYDERKKVRWSSSGTVTPLRGDVSWTEEMSSVPWCEKGWALALPPVGQG
jgi:hypothetical protein